MKQKVKIVARTVEAPVEGLVKDSVSFDKDVMRDEAIILSGKAAGICYMPDDYLSNGIQNEVTAKKRAAGNTKSGHYSVFEHAHFSFVIETSKAMAMVLNSTKLYSTSEKSGRYTSMNPETEIEKKYYEKWREKLTGIIKDTYGDSYTDKEAHKLALENARYFLSVFTPTVMMFTIPFNRVILLCEWLDKLSAIIEKSKDDCEICKKDKTNYNYYSRISKEAIELATAFRESLNLSKEEPILVDHKDIGINFYKYRSISSKKEFTKSVLNINHIDKLKLIQRENWIMDDMYSTIMPYSFACLAQEQRHRTLDYEIYTISEGLFYTPSILQNEEDKNEWKKDMNDMYNNSDVVCQGTLLWVNEKGSFENFYLKCKERVCMRAQKEIMDITVNQIKFFYSELNYYESLSFDERRKIHPFSDINKARLLSMIDIVQYKLHQSDDDILVLPRCMWKEYKCKEACTHVNYECTKNRLI